MKQFYILAKSFPKLSKRCRKKLPLKCVRETINANRSYTEIVFYAKPPLALALYPSNTTSKFRMHRG